MRTLSALLHFVQPPVEAVTFDPNELHINGKRVLDWYTNYLLDHESEFTDLGWVAGLQVNFDTPQIIQTTPGVQHLCSGISFGAELVCDRLERLVGISGTGFFNWNLQQITFPPGVTIKTDAVPTDFSQWSPRSDENKRPSGFIEIHIEATANSFQRVDNVLNLEIL